MYKFKANKPSSISNKYNVSATITHQQKNRLADMMEQTELKKSVILRMGLDLILEEYEKSLMEEE